MVEKKCLCGIKTIKMPCSQESGSCGTFCHEKLPCGHSCSKMCHAAGECASSCTQKCGQELPCGHKHISSSCHYPRTCQEVGQNLAKQGKSICVSTLTLHCKCGNLVKHQPCTGKPSPGPLPCDGSCDIYLRNLSLATALGIDPSQTRVRNSLDPITFEREYSEDLVDLYAANPAWCRRIEFQLSDMFARRLRTLRFEPMQQPLERMFVHLLAREGFNFVAKSHGEEPDRYVEVTANWARMMDSSYPRTPSCSLTQYMTRCSNK